MKTKCLLSISIFAFVALSACSTSSLQDSAVNTEDRIDSKVDVSEESPYGEDMDCNMLKDSHSVQECKLQVNNLIGSFLETEILSTFDTARCTELPESLAQSCKNNLEQTGVEGPVSKAELDRFQEIIRGTFPEPMEGENSMPMFPTYNPELCAELKTSGYKSYCERQLKERMQRDLLDEIIQSGDVSRCEELTEEKKIEICKMTLDL